MVDISAVLQDRETTHGPFAPKAVFIQDTKADFRRMPLWDELPPDQQEALDMIATKIGRILTGDPDHEDSVIDIIGYATLMLQGIRERKGNVLQTEMDLSKRD